MVTLLAGTTATLASAAPEANLWDYWLPSDEGSSTVVDHTAWDRFLGRYVDDEHPSGVNRVRYGAVTAGDRDALRAYIGALEGVPVRSLNRDEQFAFWVNLYNALTVELIVDHYPVDSIRDIKPGGLFSSGPWDAEVAGVEGEAVTLNDIEHRILRPIWNDRRIHFVVNCASIGCPNLWPQAMTAANAETILRESERDYLAHPRGVTVGGNRVTASSIFDWYRVDFGDSERDVVAYWRRYAPATVASQLDQLGTRPRIRYSYDWNLNEP